MLRLTISSRHFNSCKNCTAEESMNCYGQIQSQRTSCCCTLPFKYATWRIQVALTWLHVLCPVEWHQGCTYPINSILTNPGCASKHKTYRWFSITSHMSVPSSTVHKLHGWCRSFRSTERVVQHQQAFTPMVAPYFLLHCGCMFGECTYSLQLCSPGKSNDPACVSITSFPRIGWKLHFKETKSQYRCQFPTAKAPSCQQQATWRSWWDQAAECWSASSTSRKISQMPYVQH